MEMQRVDFISRGEVDIFISYALNSSDNIIRLVHLLALLSASQPIINY